MTPLQRAEEFHERWIQHVITSTRRDFDIVKELKRVIEDAVRCAKKKGSPAHEAVVLEAGWMKKQLERAAKEWEELPEWAKAACGVTTEERPNPMPGED